MRSLPRGWYGYFLEPHNIINLSTLFSISCHGTIDYALTSPWKVRDSTPARGGIFPTFFWLFCFAFSLSILFSFLTDLQYTSKIINPQVSHRHPLICFSMESVYMSCLCLAKSFFLILVLASSSCF